MAAPLDITITYLEMTAPPAEAVSLPPTSGIQILRAVAPPVHFYRYLYNTVGAPWLWYERRQMNDATLESNIHDPLVEIYVLYLHGVPAGYAELDRRTPDIVDLAYFGLMPDFIGQRLGGYFLHWALVRAWRDEPIKVTVNTCTLDHPAALPAYQKAGFTPVRTVTKTIPDPRTTGLIP